MEPTQDHRWVEVKCPNKGHRNFVLQEIAQRYLDEDGKYVLVAHVATEVKGDHFICGIFHDLKSCLLARAYSNFGLTLNGNIDGQLFFQAHAMDGAVVKEFMYDIGTSAIREL